MSRWPNKTTEERFWEKVVKTDTCWVWQAAQCPGTGYGHFFVAKPRQYETAHRYSWRIRYGPIPPGLFVLHSCDNRMCVRPDHLFLGTHGDNMRDAVLKGRHFAKGGYKLEPEEVIEIRQASGLHREIAARFRVTRCVVSAIKAGKSWMHL